MLSAPPLAHLILWIDRSIGWTLSVNLDGARAIASAMTATLLTFIVFIFTVLLVAVQLASVQLTPRVIARVFKDPFTKISLGVFVFIYAFSLVILGQLEEKVPLISGLLVGYGSLACVAIFIFLIDRLGKELRPVRILTSVGAEGDQVIRAMYPERIAEDTVALMPTEEIVLGEALREVKHGGHPGVILAFDRQGILALAQRADCLIEIIPQVGDFVATDDPLFRIYQNNKSIDELSLSRSIAFGPERSLEQDPTFAFRIIVDIASKALSPAINDVTTAVLAIDQLHHLLRQVGSRRLDTGNDRDATGQLRLVYRTPDWEDFVHLAVTEIRQFGGTSIQIVRRLRAMLDNLVKTMPTDRAGSLRQELSLLQRTVARSFIDPEDRILAGISDLQGVGGKSVHTDPPIADDDPTAIF